MSEGLTMFSQGIPTSFPLVIYQKVGHPRMQRFELLCYLQASLQAAVADCSEWL
jgi:hypothetical protein